MGVFTTSFVFVSGLVGLSSLLFVKEPSCSFIGGSFGDEVELDAAVVGAGVEDGFSGIEEVEEFGGGDGVTAVVGF